MEDYRSKLRSASKAAAKTTTEQEEEEKAPTEPEETNIINDPESPQTPPHQTIEFFFPPSPYHKKKTTPVFGDRFIPSRERNIARDYRILDNSLSSSSKNSTTDGNSSSSSLSSDNNNNTTLSRGEVAYLRAELLDDETAVDEYISDTRVPRRAYHFSTTPSSYTQHYHPSTISTRYSPEPSSSSSIPPNLSPSPTLSAAQHYHDTHHHDFTPIVLDSPNAPKYKTTFMSESRLRLLNNAPDYTRHINTTPIKILDAPELQDDFYLNLVDWGPTNCLAVGLGTCVYLWNANTSRVTKLCDFGTENVTSVNWAHVGSLLAVGINKGRAFLYDTETQKRIRSWSSHSSRIGAMAWKSNILSTAGRDHFIYHHDVRSPNDYFEKLVGHTQEVCGLKWNTEGTMLASGGNDNNLLVWDHHGNKLLHRFTDHIAAVKAIAWNPHRRGVLVSGGGTADKSIKFWNTMNGTLTTSHDTGSQVCNIVWSKRTNDIISSHGYANNTLISSNQVIVWKPDKMRRVATLSGHTSRVLYMAMSNDGTTVVTGAGDETLRFWDLFSSIDVRNDPEDRQTCLR